MIDEDAQELLADLQREVEDTAEQVSQAVAKLEAGDATDSEALLGEALTRLRLVAQRVEEHRGSGG